MKTQAAHQENLHRFTVKVELAVQLFILLPIILNMIYRYSCLFICKIPLKHPLFNQFSNLLPSIHLYNRKQTKLFDFVII